MKLSEIRNILLNPTKDGLTKILSITSLSNFDRVRGQFQKLKYEGYKLTLDVADLVDKRTKELFSGKVKSCFLIENVDIDKQNQKRVDELEKQLAEMKELLAQALQVKSNILNDENNTLELDEVKEVVKRGPGRPKKASSQ